MRNPFTRHRDEQRAARARELRSQGHAAQNVPHIMRSEDAQTKREQRGDGRSRAAYNARMNRTWRGYTPPTRTARARQAR